MSSRIPFVCLAVLLLTACGPDQAGVQEADLVLVNGGIYTVDADRSWAEALAARDGGIIAVGSREEVEAHIGPGTQVIDLEGRMALPGCHDSHVHVVESGYTLLGCSLLEETSLEALLARLQACAMERPDGWLVATGFDLALFGQAGPDRALLDERFPERPVYVVGSDGHSGWVNSAALRAAGISGETPDPHGGEIGRDAGTGEPNGALWDTAMDLFKPYLPEHDLESDLEALRAAQAHLLSLGVTSVTDISYTDRNWSAWEDLDQAGELVLRVTSSLVHGPYADYPAGNFEAMLANRQGYASNRLRTDSVKLFLDGVLEAHSGALLEPYLLGEPHSGALNFAADELNALVTRLDAEGLQVHMHAIGDAAVREGLDAVEAAREANGPRDNRHHITHLQLVHPDDYARFAELDVTANFQLLWAYPDEWILELNLPVVGPERVERMYPAASILREGGRIAGSSDWDVDSANPLLAIETAVRRQDAQQPDGPVLNAGERMDLADMIEAYTLNGAWLMHQEEQAGSLEAGKRADIVVLDRNLFEIPATEISETRVDLTIVDGEVVYRAPPGAGNTGLE